MALSNFKPKATIMMQQIISFVQLEPLSPAHHLTLADVELLFHRCDALDLHRVNAQI